VNINVKTNTDETTSNGNARALEEFQRIGAEGVLLKWVNFHLEAAGSSKRIRNFAGDVADSEAYVALINQIAPKNKGVNINAALNQSDLHKRAELVLENAEKIDCKKLMRPDDIVTGRDRLNLAFVAGLFMAYPGVDLEEPKKTNTPTTNTNTVSNTPTTNTNTVKTNTPTTNTPTTNTLQQTLIL